MQVKQLVVAVLTPLISGAVTFGAIALRHHSLGSLLGAGRVHAAAQSSPEPEALLSNWPRQCQVLKQALLSQPELTGVTYEARPISPFVTPAWKLAWQGETLALPLVNYSNVRIVRNEDSRLFVVLEDRETGARVMLNQLKQPQPLTDVFATVPHPSLSLTQLQPVLAASSSASSPLAVSQNGDEAGTTAETKAETELQLASQSLEGGIKAAAVKRSRTGSGDLDPTPVPNWDGPSLTERLFEGPVALEYLVDAGYRHRPQSLSCKPEAWEKELPVAMGLALKLSTGTGIPPEAVYAKVGQQPGRVLLRLAEDQTTWQARFGEGEFYADVMISLPSDHESAAVGLGMGQENWWDAEPRPEWLIALERAVAVDSQYAWDALSVELHRAGIAGAESVQGVVSQQSGSDGGGLERP